MTSPSDRLKCRREEELPRPSSRLSTVDAALETVAKKHHTDLHALTRELRGELDWIVMKAMEKDRARRYASAHDVAEDVQRYLNDEAVEACPPTAAYRLKKFARRNKAPVAAMASVALALLLGAAIATGQAVRATDAERVANRQQRVAEEQRRLAEKQQNLAKAQQQLAEEQREATEDVLYVAHMRLAQKDWADGKTIRLHGLLERYLPRPGGPDRRGWEWYYWLSQCHREKMTLQTRSLTSPSAAWSPDGQYIASASSDEGTLVWDAKTGEKLITVHMGAVAEILANLPGELRRVDRALELAEQAVEQAPARPEPWLGLGIARYRSAEWRAAADALNKSTELSVCPVVRHWLFLAMARWQLGQHDEARRCYQRAVERLVEKHEYEDQELRRLRIEAAQLLGIEKQQETKDDTKSQDKPTEDGK